MKKQTLLTALLCLLASWCSAATVVNTLDVSNVTVTNPQSPTFRVAITGDNLVVEDTGAGATQDANYAGQTINYTAGNIVNYAADLVQTKINTSGTGAQTYISFGDDVANMKEADTTYFTRLSINRTGAGDFFMGQALTAGTKYRFSLFMNNTGSGDNYTDPNGGTESLGDDTYDLWFGTAAATLTKINNDVAATDGTLANIDSVRYALRSVNLQQFSTEFSPVAIRPNDPSLPGNLVGWYSDPKNLYNATTGVWTDISGKGNDTSPPGTDVALGLQTDQTIADGGLLNGQTIDYVESDGDSDTIGAQLNSGTPLGQFTIIALMDYASTSSNDRVGFGFYPTDSADNFHLAGDGSIRKDNGNIAGSGPVPASEFFIRTASFNSGTYNDYYIQATGTTVNKSGGSFGATTPSTDSFYMGDVRTATSGDRFAQVVVYDTNLSQVEIENIARWMAENPNGVPEPSTFALAAFGLLGLLACRRRRRR